MNRQKRIFTFLGIAFICFHFFMIVIYVSPDGYFNQWYQKGARFYVDPLFTQHWSLFAPEPPMQDIVIEYRLWNKKNSTEWINPCKEVLELHNKNRLHPNSKLLRLNQHVAFFLLRDYKDIQKKKIVYQLGENRGVTNIKNSFGYKTAILYCAQLAKNKGVEDFKDIEIKLVLENPVPFTQRNAKNTLPVKQQINFPKALATK